VCCRVLQCIAVCCSVLLMKSGQIRSCCSTLQCVAVIRDMLLIKILKIWILPYFSRTIATQYGGQVLRVNVVYVLQFVAVCSAVFCSVLQCVVVCCRVVWTHRVSTYRVNTLRENRVTPKPFIRDTERHQTQALDIQSHYTHRGSRYRVDGDCFLLLLIKK